MTWLCNFDYIDKIYNFIQVILQNNKFSLLQFTLYPYLYNYLSYSKKITLFSSRKIVCTTFQNSAILFI